MLNKTNNLFNQYRASSVLVFFLLVLKLECTTAQVKDTTEIIYSKTYQHNYSEIFKKRYWNFFVRPLMSIQKGTYYKDKDFFFALHTAPGFQFGWMMNVGLPKHFSVQTGFNVEVNYITFHNSVRENYFMKNIGTNNKITSNNYIAYLIPIYVCYKFPVYNKHNNFFIETKLGFDLKLGDVTKVTSQDYSQLNDSVILQTSNFNKGWGNPKIGTGFKFSASIVAGIGFNFILKNQRIINFQIIGSYNPFINDSGTMTFMPDSPFEKNVSFRNHINTLGFELNYLFTKYPKHITKKQAKKAAFQNAISK